MTTTPLQLRKAAILVASLDTRVADQLLDQLPAEQAAIVRRMLVSLGEIDPREQESVIREFRLSGAGLTPAAPSASPAVRPFPRSATSATNDAAGSFPDRAAQEIRDEIELSGERPFGMLEQADPAMLGEFLKTERPLTIAQVVSHLSPGQSARVLSALSAELRGQVMTQVTSLVPASGMVLQELEESLAAKLRNFAESNQRRSQGMDVVGKILESVDPRQRKRMLAELATQDAQLASQFNGPQWTLDDLENLSESELAALIAAASPELVRLALAAAPETLLERIIRPLDPKEARQFKRAIEKIGPTRISDIDQAQKQLLDLAEELSLDGKLRHPRARSRNPGALAA